MNAADKAPAEDVKLANALARFFRAVDSRDWDSASSLMTRPFHIDYTSFGADAAQDLEPATVLDGWKQLLPGFEHTHHQIGNLEIERHADEARVRSYVTATHQIADRVWTVVGTYETTLTKESAEWKLSRLCFGFKYQAGDSGLPDEARSRAQAAGGDLSRGV